VALKRATLVRKRCKRVSCKEAEESVEIIVYTSPVGLLLACFC
jgi:hypothetical protein